MAMENSSWEKYKKIALIVFVVVIIGWMIYQQVTLNALKELVLFGNQSGSGTGQNVPADHTLSDDAVQQAKSDLIANTSDITGKVVSVSGNLIKI